MLDPLGWRLTAAVAPIYEVGERYLVYSLGHFFSMRVWDDGVYMHGLSGRESLRYAVGAECDAMLKASECSFFRLLKHEVSHALEKYCDL